MTKLSPRGMFAKALTVMHFSKEVSVHKSKPQPEGEISKEKVVMNSPGGFKKQIPLKMYSQVGDGSDELSDTFISSLTINGNKDLVISSSKSDKDNLSSQVRSTGNLKTSSATSADLSSQRRAQSANAITKASSQASTRSLLSTANQSQKSSASSSHSEKSASHPEKSSSFANQKLSERSSSDIREPEVEHFNFGISKHERKDSSITDKGISTDCERLNSDDPSLSSGKTRKKSMTRVSQDEIDATKTADTNLSKTQNQKIESIVADTSSVSPLKMKYRQRSNHRRKRSSQLRPTSIASISSHSMRGDETSSQVADHKGSELLTTETAVLTSNSRSRSLNQIQLPITPSQTPKTHRTIRTTTRRSLSMSHSSSERNDVPDRTNNTITETVAAAIAVANNTSNTTSRQSRTITSPLVVKKRTSSRSSSRTQSHNAMVLPPLHRAASSRTMRSMPNLSNELLGNCIDTDRKNKQIHPAVITSDLLIKPCKQQEISMPNEVETKLRPPTPSLLDHQTTALTSSTPDTTKSSTKQEESLQDHLRYFDDDDLVTLCVRTNHSNSSSITNVELDFSKRPASFPDLRLPMDETAAEFPRSVKHRGPRTRRKKGSNVSLH